MKITGVKITDTERKALELLRQMRSLTCTELGEEMWGTRYRVQQAYARPAGKVLHGLKRRGLVDKFPCKHCIYWRLTTKGRNLWT